MPSQASSKLSLMLPAPRNADCNKTCQLYACTDEPLGKKTNSSHVRHKGKIPRQSSTGKLKLNSPQKHQSWIECSCVSTRERQGREATDLPHKRGEADNLSTWISESRKPPLTAHEVNPHPLRLNEKGGHQRETQILKLCCVQQKPPSCPFTS